MFRRPPPPHPPGHPSGNIFPLPITWPLAPPPSNHPSDTFPPLAISCRLTRAPVLGAGHRRSELLFALRNSDRTRTVVYGAPPIFIKSTSCLLPVNHRAAVQLVKKSSSWT